MQSGKLLTIITPTFNRRDKLGDLLNSLLKQTVNKFEWLVIDDGSTDGTKDWFASLSPLPFSFQYHAKQNGGKHTALNAAHPYIRGEWVCVVDSDDTLTSDAVETILAYWEKYEQRQDVAQIIFQRGCAGDSAIPFDNSFSRLETISTLAGLKNRGMHGDHFETVRTEDFLQFLFPEFPGEKFIGEDWLWMHIGLLGKCVFVNKVLYICEYLEGGLTKSGRRMRIQNPRGGMEHARVLLNKRLKLTIRMKQALLYACYSKFAGVPFGDCYKDVNCPLVRIAYPFGLVLFAIWRSKYL